ncbi:hypothetical protein [Paraclostridium bifermentans]|uniref:hypothetical protein n=1 Tax=Paraclostridium bifermentans TaxID=1490 RepID=UPI00359C1803
MDYVWLNKGSILFGLISVIMPIIAIMCKDNTSKNNLGLFSIISISSCAISLCMQIHYANHLVNIEDWSALMDLLGTVANVSTILVLATIVLNIVTYIIYNKTRI